ncbi:Dihydroorotase [compost metagenome]
MPLLLKAGLDIGLITEKLAINPRKLLNLAIPVIEEGAKANFTVVNTGEKWLYNATSNFSKSANSPLLGAELTGKVTLVYNNSQYSER